MSYPEYYKILGVEPSASMKEIKQAYHELAKKLHPDLNENDKKSEEKLKKVNEAYAVLKDAAKRAEYDYFGKQALEAERLSNRKIHIILKCKTALHKQQQLSLREVFGFTWILRLVR